MVLLLALRFGSEDIAFNLQSRAPSNLKFTTLQMSNPNNLNILYLQKSFVEKDRRKATHVESFLQKRR